MDYGKLMGYWNRIFRETNLVEETLETKVYEDEGYEIKSYKETDETIVHLYDLKNSLYFLVFWEYDEADAYLLRTKKEDGEDGIDFLQNRKTWIGRTEPFQSEAFCELTKHLVEKLILKTKPKRLYKDELFAIEDYSTLMQYLALGYKIKVNNGLVDIEIWMEDNYKIKGLNQNFKDLPPYDYSTEMTLENVILGVVPQLKEQEPEEFKTFENRWEEIKAITLETVALNKLNLK